MSNISFKKLEVGKHTRGDYMCLSKVLLNDFKDEVALIFFYVWIDLSETVVAIIEEITIKMYYDKLQYLQLYQW